MLFQTAYIGVFDRPFAFSIIPSSNKVTVGYHPTLIFFRVKTEFFFRNFFEKIEKSEKRRLSNWLYVYLAIFQYGHGSMIGRRLCDPLAASHAARQASSQKQKERLRVPVTN